MKNKIGVDLGGTNMRVGVVANGRIIEKEIIPCPAQADKMTVVNTLADLIAKYITPETEGVGVGVPTLVDSRTGTVYRATNIPSWDEVPLRDLLTERLGIKVEINNDANCFALGEKQFGAGRDLDSMVGITLGTGTGSGLIIGGKLYCGRNTGAGEIGEMPYRDHNFEYYCSSPFFVREYGCTGAEAAEAARAGDSRAQAIWDYFGRNVGCMLKALLNAYDPDGFVFGGGISSAFDLFEPAMMKELSTFWYAPALKGLVIARSELDEVAILGASALV